MAERKKVMVIDDEPFIGMMIEDKLRPQNFEVIFIRDSTIAINMIKKEMPDLIILDWMMPKVNGLNILKDLKAESELSKIPVFMLTAKGQESDEITGLKYGADRYITKPFSPKELLELVIETIGRP